MSALLVILKMLQEAVRALGSLIWQAAGSVMRPVWLTVRTLFHIEEDEWLRPAALLIAVLIFGGAATAILRSIRWRTPPPTNAPFIGLGDVAAEETIRLVGPTGKIVLVVQVGKPPHAPATVAVEQFKSALAKAGGLLVLATETIPPPASPASSGMTADQFLKLLDEYGLVEAVVSFAVTPDFEEADYKRLRHRRPKVVIVSMPVSKQTRALIERNVVQVAIVARPAPMSLGETATTPRQWFDGYFRVVTSANVGELE